MIKLPHLTIERPNKPFDSFKYEELLGTSDTFREFMKVSEKLKCVGEHRLGPFEWQESDEIPEEGKIRLF
jgi:hypothetical protein